jgi:hypothetical protein
MNLELAATDQAEMKWHVTAETIKTKIKVGNHEVALPSFEMPSSSSWDDSSHRAEINWELYHDLILTGTSIGQVVYYT